MMPKEKAKELVRKYYTFGLNNPAQSFSWYECKECALIAVNEILNVIHTNMEDKYWEEVKQEIENYNG